MSEYFENISKKLGFGFMRLPVKNGEIDCETLCSMVDMFIEAGFNYFDTAHGYMGEKSEAALKKCLSDRYSRDKFILTTKLTENYFNSQSDIRPFFESQLKECGVDYFDFYLMHAQNAGNYEKYNRCKAYETAFELKKEGKIRHVGLSFHDKASLLDRILTEHPDVEAVQLQFNYIDYDDPAVESKRCYEVCRKHGKPVIVMEPVKGGSLADPPKEARDILDSLGGGSPASYAIRYAAGFDGVMMVLSGMSNKEQLADNISYMADFKPLDETEKGAVERVRGIFKGLDIIPCTSCRYCVDGCPAKISIPDLFACLNAKRQFKDWNSDYYYNSVHTVNGGKASECVKCGKCEHSCPQHLEIRSLLEETAAVFEGK